MKLIICTDVCNKSNNIFADIHGLCFIKKACAYVAARTKDVLTGGKRELSKIYHAPTK
jgi:hypothetical protein